MSRTLNNVRYSAERVPAGIPVRLRGSCAAYTWLHLAVIVRATTLPGVAVLAGQIGSNVPTSSADGVDEGRAVFAGLIASLAKATDAHRLDGDLRAFHEDRRVRVVPR
ncbi:MAG: hypothetical protein M3460_25840 [Actinomycetota bacterium]|nr:hypothetical protein [Actinomycetota bacterium]